MAESLGFGFCVTPWGAYYLSRSPACVEVEARWHLDGHRYVRAVQLRCPGCRYAQAALGLDALIGPTSGWLASGSDVGQTVSDPVEKISAGGP